MPSKITNYALYYKLCPILQTMPYIQWLLFRVEAHIGSSFVDCSFVSFTVSSRPIISGDSVTQMDVLRMNLVQITFV